MNGSLDFDSTYTDDNLSSISTSTDSGGISMTVVVINSDYNSGEEYV